jgi:hypothetical protein
MVSVWLIRSARSVCAGAALFCASFAHAQPAATRAAALDVTMALLPEHAKAPDAITRAIALPRARERSAARNSPAQRPRSAQRDADAGREADAGRDADAEHAEAAASREALDHGAALSGPEAGVAPLSLRDLAAERDFLEQAREKRDDVGHGRDEAAAEAREPPARDDTPSSPHEP